ncbi:MAG: alpha/beta hydrolase, partial [Anaerolineae bacterium]
TGFAREKSGLVHRVAQPSISGPHPTVVMLHGRSGTEDVMWIFAKTVPVDWLLVAPRGIMPDPAGGFDWRPRGQDEWPSLADFDEAVTAVAHFIHTLPDLYQADPGRIYLMGFSQGAAAAYATALRHPGLVQGIAGLVGFIPTHCDSALEESPLADLPIFMAVGKRDPLIPTQRSAGCAQTLTMAGTHLEYHEYDTGHRLNAAGLRDLQAWWSEQNLS